MHNGPQEGTHAAIYISQQRLQMVDPKGQLPSLRCRDDSLPSDLIIVPSLILHLFFVLALGALMPGHPLFLSARHRPANCTTQIFEGDSYYN